MILSGQKKQHSVSYVSIDVMVLCTVGTIRDHELDQGHNDQGHSAYDHNANLIIVILINYVRITF